jgi:hypothetical protein
MSRASTLVVALVAGLSGCQGAKVSSGASGGAGGTTGAGGAAGNGGQSPPSPAPPFLPPGGGVAPDAGPVSGTGGAGGAGGACAEEVHAAEQTPVDILLLVDKSGSMIGPKWLMTSAALASFAQDPRSAGLGLGVSFFPAFANGSRCSSDTDCGLYPPVGDNVSCMERRGCVGPAGVDRPPPFCGAPNDPPCATGTTCVPVGVCALTRVDCLAIGQPCPGSTPQDLCTGSGKYCRWDYTQAASCQPGDYDKLDAPFRALPAGATAVLGAIARNEPWAGTPTLLAVNGALAQLRRHLQANPSHQGVLVLATDGLPTGCALMGDSEDPSPIVAALQTARSGTPSIISYAIGVFDVAKDGMAGPQLVNRLAAAGGSGTAFVLSPTEDLTQKLTAALNQIRGAVLPCEFTIPTPATGTLDYGRVNVRFRGAMGDLDIPYVGAANRCDPARGGWYYDEDPATARPARVLMCPATCTRFKSEATGKVQIAFGCRTLVID